MIKKKNILFIIIYIFNCLSAFSQNPEAAIWFVGDKKLDFNTTPPTITTQAAPYLGGLRSSSICDKNGNLLFCINHSKTILDKNLQELPNGQQIDFNRPPVFLQLPETPNIYYLINNNKYTVIDTTLNNGNGDVVLKNQVWNNLKFGRIYITRHANCVDYWLIGLNDTSFCSYLVTKDGISTLPTVTHSEYILGIEGNISIDGNYYATYIANAGQLKGIEFGIFNRVTGKFNKLSINFLSVSLFNSHCCFSPDNTKFYFITHKAGHRHLYQVNIQNNVFDFDNRIEISKEPTFATNWGRMQVGNDGKIYECNSYYKRVNIIHKPNLLGSSCNFEFNAISLNKRGIIPQFVATWADLLTCELDFFSDTDCSLEKIFSINNTANIQSVLWDFGDGTSSTEQNPAHEYVTEGIYTVTLTVTYTNSTTQTTTKDIEVVGKPEKPIIEHE